MQIIQHCWQFCRCVFRQFINDECPLRATALSYTTLLSLVPLIAVGLAILTAFPAFQALSQNVQDIIFSHFVTASAENVQNYIQQFVHQATRLSTIGLLFLIITAVLLMVNIEHAFNVIWRVKQRRHLVSAFLLYWGVITLTPLLLGVGISMNAYVQTLFTHFGLTNANGPLHLLFSWMPYGFTFLAFTLLYAAVPNCKVPFRSAAISGVVATVLFELAKYGFSLYVSYSRTYQLLYGTLAAIPLFLIWIYLSWWLILLSAVIGYNLSGRRSLSE